MIIKFASWTLKNISEKIKKIFKFMEIFFVMSGDIIVITYQHFQIDV